MRREKTARNRKVAILAVLFGLFFHNTCLAQKQVKFEGTIESAFSSLGGEVQLTLREQPGLDLRMTLHEAVRYGLAREGNIESKSEKRDPLLSLFSEFTVQNSKGWKIRGIASAVRGYHHVVSLEVLAKPTKPKKQMARTIPKPFWGTWVELSEKGDVVNTILIDADRIVWEPTGMEKETIPAQRCEIKGSKALNFPKSMTVGYKIILGEKSPMKREFETNMTLKGDTLHIGEEGEEKQTFKRKH